MLYVDYRTYNFKKQYTNIGQTQESKTYRLCEIAKLEAHAKSIICKQPILAFIHFIKPTCKFCVKPSSAR